MGEVAKPTGVASLLASSAFPVQLILMAMLFAGATIQKTFELPDDHMIMTAIRWMVANKMIVIGGYLIYNVLVQKLSATGAFDVSYGDKLIFTNADQRGSVPAVDILARLVVQKTGLLPIAQYSYLQDGSAPPSNEGKLD